MFFPIFTHSKATAREITDLSHFQRRATIHRQGDNRSFMLSQSTEREREERESGGEREREWEREREPTRPEMDSEHVVSVC